tara:strand:- start:1119 stop:1709 length:591 start_codon:yes stop_codon:yes gene_type:complete
MQRQLAKTFLRTAGTALGSYLDDALRLGGNVGQNLATTALKAGKAKFAPQLVGKTGSEVPMLLREGAKSSIPTAGRLIGQGAVIGTGLAAAGIMDQQSEYSQPMSGNTGNSEMDKFMMQQQLQNQKFQHDMQLVQARAESRIPGAQYPGSLMNMTQRSDVLRDRAEAERLYTDAGEITNREVLGIARSLYGTGLRA